MLNNFQRDSGVFKEVNTLLAPPQIRALDPLLTEGGIHESKKAEEND